MTKPDASRRKLAIAAIFALPFFWGPTFAIVQGALPDITPMAFVVLRFWLAGSIFLLSSKSARKGLKILIRPHGGTQRKFRQDMVVLGSAIGAGYVFQTIGLLTTTSSKSAFLTSTTIIWTPLLSLILGRERITSKLVIAVAVTLMGIYFMTHPFSETGIVIGDVLTIGCAISFSVYIAWIDLAMPHAMKFALNENEATMMVTSSQIVAAAIIFLVFLPILETPRVHFTAFGFGAILYTAVIATSLSGYLQTRFQHHVTPTSASIIYMLEPVVALAIGALFLHERMGFDEMLGGGLIITGVIIAQTKLRARNKLASKVKTGNT